MKGGERALPNNHYSGHRKTTKNKDLEKEMWIAGFKYSYRRMKQ